MLSQFEGAPVIVPPLVQQGRNAVAHEGFILDTRLCAPLTDDENAELRKILEAEESRLLPERQAARAAWELTHIEGKIYGDREGTGFIAGDQERPMMECCGLLAPEHIRKKYYPNVQPHRAAKLLAFRAGSYTVKVCEACASVELKQTYPGGQWWTRAGTCVSCGIDVYLNPAMTLQRRRHPETILLCISNCGRSWRVSSRAAIRAEQEATLRAEREAIEARRQERQRQDQLILALWPEEEAYRPRVREKARP